MKKIVYIVLFCLLLVGCMHENTPNITDLEIINLPNKTSYYIDEEILFEGLVVQLNYDNGAKNIITNYEIVCDELVPGKNIVTIKYKSFTDSFEITIIDRTSIIELKVNKLPDKMEYFKGEIIDLTGLEIVAVLNNGEEIVVNDYEISYDQINEYKTKVIINYEKNISFDIVFKEKVKNEINNHQDYTSKSTKCIQVSDYYQTIADVVYGVYRNKDMIIVYDENQFIQTNAFGYEIAVDKTGKVVEKDKKVSLPEGGFVISGHSAGATKIKTINLGDYIIYKDTQLFIYHNDEIINYNDVFYLFYNYVEAINSIKDIDLYNMHVEKINALIPKLDQFYNEYDLELRNELIKELSDLPSDIEREHEFRYSYRNEELNELKLSTVEGANYNHTSTYDEKLYIGGFRSTNTLVYYDKDCYRERNNYGYEIGVNKEGIVVSKSTIVSLEEDGFILSGHGTAADYLYNNIKLYDKVEIVDGKVYVYRDFVVDLKQRCISLYNDLIKLINTDMKNNIPHDYEYLLDNVDKLNRIVNIVESNEANFYDFQRLSSQLRTFECIIATCYAQLIEYDADLSRGMWYYPFKKLSFYDDTTLEGVKSTIKKFKMIGINEIIIYTFVDNYCLFENDIFYYYEELNNYDYGEYGNDYLKCFIEECHKENIIVNAFTQTFREYISTMKNSSEDYYQLNYQLERTKGNIYYYDICNDNVQNELITWYKQLVSMYDFDKVEYDIIRYPSSNLYSYLETDSSLDPNKINDQGYTEYSMNKFMRQYNYNGDLRTLILNDKLVRKQWLEFKEAELISFITKCTTEMKKIKPDLVVTAAVLNGYDQVKKVYLQDYRKWLTLEIVDELEIMMYTPFIDYYETSINDIQDLYESYNIRNGTSAIIDVNDIIIDIKEILISSKKDGFVLYSSSHYTSKVFIDILAKNHYQPYLNDLATDDDVVNMEIKDAIKMIEGYYSYLYDSDFSTLVNALKNRTDYEKEIMNLKYEPMKNYLISKLNL